MKTQTTKDAEILQFEKLPDMYIIRGAIRTLYKRHHEFFNMAFCGALGLAFGLILGIFG